MIRLALIALAVATTAWGCTSRPSESACQSAIDNIRKLTGQTHTKMGADPKAAVRACRSQSSPETVECMIEARTKEELFACGGKIAKQLEAATAAETKTETDTKTKTETETDSDSETETETDSDSDSETETETETDSDSDSEAETESETEAETETEAEAEAEAESESEADTAGAGKPQ